MRHWTSHGLPDKITIDKSGANSAAIASVKTDTGPEIELRQNKYLNNIVEQDHRAIKRITRATLGFKPFRCARILLAGIEVMHMLRKGQLPCPGGGATRVRCTAVLQLGFLIRSGRIDFSQLRTAIATKPEDG